MLYFRLVRKGSPMCSVRISVWMYLMTPPRSAMSSSSIKCESTAELAIARYMSKYKTSAGFPLYSTTCGGGGGVAAVAAAGGGGAAGWAGGCEGGFGVVFDFVVFGAGLSVVFGVGFSVVFGSGFSVVFGSDFSADFGLDLCSCVSTCDCPGFSPSFSSALSSDLCSVFGLSFTDFGCSWGFCVVIATCSCSGSASVLGFTRV
mmetsp:Transcript_144702/g.360700  ORF Transcript_144702/g.360700 Transcript_144702/m.360700 type:complete len:203 (+) Transcript_144702:2131-2739(+)